MLRLTYVQRSAAGGSAEARYRAVASRWRQRVLAPYRWLFILVGGVPVAIVIARPSHSLLDWVCGLVLGASITMWIALADTPPAYIENWRMGADAEKRTARALAPLRRAGWQLAHDLQTERGNRDHIAIGPGGVFLLDTKCRDGVLKVEGDVVHVEREDDPDASYELHRLAPSIRGAARQLKKELDGHGTYVGWVQAVVVVWANFPQRVVEGDRVSFVHGDELADWLTSRPASPRAAQIARVGEIIANDAL